MSARGPLRLLLTADAVGGVWQYATDLARSLLPLGVRPAILLMGPPASDAQRALVAEGVELIESGLPLDWLADGPEPVLAAAREVARIAAGHDLVQLNMPSLAAGGRFPVPTIAVAHGCLSTWWEAAGGGALPPDMAWQVALTRDGLRAADAVVAPTLAFARLVERHYGLAATPAVVHNGRRPLGPAGDGAPSGEAFTAGRLWDRAKNVGLLDEVAGRLGLPFLAAGATQGPHGEMLRCAHLRTVGVLDEQALAERLARRPVFVSAARFEPFGLAVLEAAQAGCPLVLSDIPSFRELWDGAALFVDAHDADGFVAAIERVAGDAGMARAFGAAARERARRYVPEATAAAMAALYEGLTGRARVAA